MTSQSDRGFRVDHEIVSKERSTSVGEKLRKLRHVKKEGKRADRASLGNTLVDRNFPGCGLRF